MASSNVDTALQGQEANSIATHQYANPLGNEHDGQSEAIFFGEGKAIASPSAATEVASTTDGITKEIMRVQQATITITKDSTVGSQAYSISLNPSVDAAFAEQAQRFTMYRIEDIRVWFKNTAAIASASGGMWLYTQPDPYRPALAYNTSDSRIKHVSALSGSRLISVRESGGVAFQSSKGEWKWCMPGNDLRFTEWGHIGAVVAAAATDGEARWVITVAATFSFKGLNRIPPAVVTRVMTPEVPINTSDLTLVTAGGEWYILRTLPAATFATGHFESPQAFGFDVLVKDETTDESKVVTYDSYFASIKNYDLGSGSAFGYTVWFDARGQNINNPVIENVNMTVHPAGILTTFTTAKCEGSALPVGSVAGAHYDIDEYMDCAGKPPSARSRATNQEIIKTTVAMLKLKYELKAKHAVK